MLPCSPLEGQDQQRGPKSVSPPWRVGILLRVHLPTKVEGPSGVDSPVRLRRRTLTRPVRPLWAFSAHFRKLSLPGDISLPASRRFQQDPGHETPRQISGFAHRPSPFRDSIPHPGFPPSVRSHLAPFHLSVKLFKAARPFGRPGSPEPADVVIIAAYGEEYNALFRFRQKIL